MSNKLEDELITEPEELENKKKEQHKRNYI